MVQPHLEYIHLHLVNPLLILVSMPLNERLRLRNHLVSHFKVQIADIELEYIQSILTLGEFDCGRLL